MTSFDSLFKRLAQADFSRTLQLADAIEIPEVSAIAQLAACRAVLSRPFTPGH
jgi:hypothetical protein